jgi:uncharacterized alkaline shock family protein YloU
VTAPDAIVPLAPAAERGTTVVADRAVQRVVARLTDEFEEVGGAARRMLGITMGGEDFDRDAQVDIRVDGSTVTAVVRCSVAYPTPVRATAESLRTHLAERVAELTGLTLGRVDITVTALHDNTIRRVL